METKDYVGDILETEKNMVVNYAIALNEASCEKLYKEYKKEFESISDCAKTLFNIAYNNGWYNLEEAQNSKVKEEATKLKEELKCACEED
jgi:spore coat protein CotF